MANSFRLLFLILATAVLAACSRADGLFYQLHPHHPDLPPDASSEQIRKAAKDQKDQLKDAAKKGDDQAKQTIQAQATLDDVAKMGVRNLDWLKHINSLRPADQPLSFSNKGTESGYPMDKPSAYSDKIVLASFEQAKKDMPKEIYAVLIDGEPFTDTPPIETQAYLDWGLKLDKIYQSGARWQMMLPYLDELAQRKQEDIRGYYFLSIEPDLKSELALYHSLPKADHDRLKQWLLMICYNTLANEAACANALLMAEEKGTVQNFFNKFDPASKKMYDDYFTIDQQDARTDVTWTSQDPNVFNFPFKDPQTPAVNDYLKTNIEDEWKWNDWHLVINFVSDALTHVVFVAGSTPHVNGLGGSEITMDANAPLTEWDVQWTIRHEFGHTLGFKDCYVEFYDPDSKTIINYQLDVTNLMCSRQGRFKEVHFNELKRVYFK